MTDRITVYTKVLATLKTMMTLSHPRHLISLAMLIAGMVVSRHSQLAQISAEIPGAVQDASTEMRLRRWVKHVAIDADVVYLPFAQQILHALAHRPLAVVMDGSQVGRGCMTLMVSVVYQHRALPVAWLVYRGTKGHTTAERHIQVLSKVGGVMPVTTTDVVLRNETSMVS